MTQDREQYDDIIDRLNARIDKIASFAYSGMHIDGVHHKQWYLEEIAKEAGLQITPEEGIKP